MQKGLFKFFFFFDLLKIKEPNVIFDRFHFYNATHYLDFFKCVIGFVAICSDTDIQNTYGYEKNFLTPVFAYQEFLNIIKRYLQK